MSARDQRVLLLAAVFTSALLLLAAVAGHPELLAYAAPLFVLAVPLIAGRYVGEDRLERLRCASLPRPSRVPARVAAGGRRTMVSVARGGRLIADALAERGPPRAVLS
jgi:hypothetical protein